MTLLEQPMILGGDPTQEGCISVAPLLDGDRIHSLEIKCSCGQQMSVECVYPELGQATEAVESTEAAETEEPELSAEDVS